LMCRAIEKCREGIAAGQSPFGCAIGRAGRILSVAHHCGFATRDVTAHAEVVALREACREAGDFVLAGEIQTAGPIQRGKTRIWRRKHGSESAIRRPSYLLDTRGPSVYLAIFPLQPIGHAASFLMAARLVLS
jgi:pyrimidine deaminase RibD-like protein